ncbi:MAG: alpha/beta fold hydrolase, partial [Alphaproteobacteria bacterium]
MSLLAAVFLVLLILVVVVVVAAKLFEHLYYNDRRPDAIHFARTEDGWNLALHRYDPPAGAKKKTPVICCHGLAGNRHGFDLTANASLARTLAETGHPTFLLELRGAGCSDHGGPGKPRPLAWRVSHHYRFDAPAAIEKVCALTGAKKVHWVGHSMGGMVAYAFLQNALAKKISRCVILASPSTFREYRPAHKFAPVLKCFPGVPIRMLSQCVAPTFEWFRPLQNVSGNQFLAPGVAALSAVNCQSQLPSELLADFARFIENGHYLDDEGRDMLAGMKTITTPTLFLVGAEDLTARDNSVLAAYESFGSKEKKFV